ncbi:MAG TPA: tRNA-uridine aminocarboxypropyltransferase [Polyangiaceae bacterium]|nr:tRNA-uridine aminocarboxypropyltransferase [Polyangiaceae bacterium]
MPGRFHDAPRCVRCRLHVGLCLCASLPSIETRTRVLVVMHRFEDRKPTNTGRLVAACLPNSDVYVRGEESRMDRPLESFEGVRPVVLFPGPTARPLADFLGGDGPVTLVVPDGNWRQAGKTSKRVRELASLPCAALPHGPPSEYALRRESRPERLSTMEAVARALGLLEGPEVEAALLTVFRTVVERALWARGSLRSADVVHGLPEGARPHDPRSGLSSPGADACVPRTPRR